MISGILCSTWYINGVFPHCGEIFYRSTRLIQRFEATDKKEVHYVCISEMIP